MLLLVVYISSHWNIEAWTALWWETVVELLVLLELIWISMLHRGSLESKPSKLAVVGV